MTSAECVKCGYESRVEGAVENDVEVEASCLLGGWKILRRNFVATFPVCFCSTSLLLLRARLSQLAQPAQLLPLLHHLSCCLTSLATGALFAHLSSSLVKHGSSCLQDLYKVPSVLPPRPLPRVLQLHLSQLRFLLRCAY